MPKKNILIIGLIIILLMGLGVHESQAQGSQSGQAYSVDQEQCALMLRKGKESFTRGKYTEAKELFRKAILADPNSQKAWSYYDLAQMYSVAEQFKNHGRIVQSSAPPAEQTEEMAQPRTTAAPPPPPAMKEKGKGVPAKKEKPAIREKTPAPKETPKVEPSKAGRPAPVPAPPAPTPAPGGFKILKDEGC